MTQTFAQTLAAARAFVDVIPAPAEALATLHDYLTDIESAAGAPNPMTATPRPFVERTMFVTLEVTLAEIASDDDEEYRSDPDVVSDLTEDATDFADLLANHLSVADSELWDGTGYWLKINRVAVAGAHWTGEPRTIETPRSDAADDAENWSAS